MRGRVILDSCAVDKNFSSRFPTLAKMIERGSITAVYGGSKYFDEMVKNSKLAELISQLNNAGMAVRYDAKNLKPSEAKVRSIFAKCSGCAKPCNDAHIYTLMLVDPVRLIVTGDKKIVTCYKCLKKHLGEHFGLPRPKLILGDNSVKACLKLKLL